MEPMEPSTSANVAHRKPLKAMEREQMSLKNKLDIIEQLEEGKKQVDVAVAYGLSKQTCRSRRSTSLSMPKRRSC